ncbi:MAG: 5'/3'-nucleotidase SurE [Dehalococcoidia bacterium]
MKVLVTNDDGINAPGLWTLVRSLKQVAQVVVVAPDREQSGVGTSISLHNPLRVARPHPPVEDVETYSVEGTPGDAVILALGHLVKGGVDLVIAGINEGANLGNDVYISGTVGAAFQGWFYGLPSVALSVASLHDVKFEAAAKLAPLLVNLFAREKLPRNLLLNVTLPNIPLYDVQGIEATRLAQRSYADVVEEGWDGKRQYYWIVRGKAEWKDEPGTDVRAVRMGRIALTPLSSNNPQLGSTLRRLCFPLYVELLSARPGM